MSVVVRLGGQGPAPRGRERLLIAAGALAGMLLLGALPLPRIREAREQRERCASLEEKVERVRADAAAVRAWESGEREGAPALHAEYRRWFASEPRTETRERLLQAARSVDVRIIDVAVADAAPGAFAIPATRELVTITGEGRAEQAALLAAMLPKLDPPLRLLSWELTRNSTTGAFTIVAERFREQPESKSR